MNFIDDTARRKLKRSLKRRHQETIESVAQADQQIEKLLIRRFDRLSSVKRFIFLWLALFCLLILTTYLQVRGLSPYYQTLQPAPGGLYNEGLIGTFTNANPLYASGTADSAVSRLVFSGLFKYDSSNNLVGDLATDYQVGTTAKTYTVHLRKNVTWQDGKPFTADDVVFTYKTIQNIESQSPLYSSWQGTTITKQDPYTVVFTLSDELSSFPYSLTNGIVPEHLLAKIPVSQLRSAPFNTAPVGAGPFSWKFIEVSGTDTQSRQQSISLTAFKHYWAGKPKLDGISLITYSDDLHLVHSFEAKQVNAMSGLESVPAKLQTDQSVQVYRTPLTATVMAFFNNSRPMLSDAKVRQALIASVDRSELGRILGEPVQLVNGPLLRGQLGFDAGIGEQGFNKSAAEQILDQAGWKADASGVRSKNGQPLELHLSAQNTSDYTQVAQFLQKEWSALGVKLDVSYYSSDDLQTSIIGSHSYDVLLYGISIGVDPDVFAYWDSSQASLTSQGHLNLSEYKSTAADAAVEAGRTRADPAIRAVKYHAFQQDWVNDAPALSLYQPNFLYITRGSVFNYHRTADNTGVDRFYNANIWMIRQQRQVNK